MSPYGSISTVYRAEVRIPEDVYQRFGHTKEYEHFNYTAASCVEVSGTDSYSEVIEWGEDPVLRNCEEFIDTWHKRIVQWQEQLAAVIPTPDVRDSSWGEFLEASDDRTT